MRYVQIITGGFYEIHTIPLDPDEYGTDSVEYHLEKFIGDTEYQDENGDPADLSDPVVQAAIAFATGTDVSEFVEEMRS